MRKLAMTYRFNYWWWW